MARIRCIRGVGASIADAGIQFETGGDITSTNFKMLIRGNGIINFTSVPNHANQAAATAAGLVTGDVYRNGADLKIVT